MGQPTLKEVYLNELTKDVSQRYVYKIRSKEDKELYKDLYKLAKMIAVLYKKGLEPTVASEKLKTFISLHPEMNPLKHFDTMGVKMFLHSQEKDSKVIGKEKRYYEDVIQAYLKNYL